MSITQQLTNPFTRTDFANNSAPVLNHATAAQYVRDYFAASCRDGGGNDKAFISSIKPMEMIDGEIAFDVHFGLNNLRGNECMTVWLEKRRDGSSYLYGEW